MPPNWGWRPIRSSARARNSSEDRFPDGRPAAAITWARSFSGPFFAWFSDCTALGARDHAGAVARFTSVSSAKKQDFWVSQYAASLQILCPEPRLTAEVDKWLFRTMTRRPNCQTKTWITHKAAAGQKPATARVYKHYCPSDLAKTKPKYRLCRSI